MKILVFDTCFNKSYVVLSNDNNIINSDIIESSESNYHSAYIISHIRNILKQNNMKIEDLNAIGINIGPGSFTGVRAGITIARVLAQQFNIKLIGIPSLKILSKLNKTKKNTLVITDARKNKVYTALYSSTGENLIAPTLEDKDNIHKLINESVEIITDKSIKEFLKNNNCINYEEDDENIGIFLSELVYESLNANPTESYNWAKIKPLYIQPPSITKPKGNTNV